MTSAEPGFTGPTDIDPIPKAAYKDASGLRHESPAAPALKHDTVADYREGRSATVAPGAGNGLVDVLVCTAETMDATGILLLDGTPIAAGDGRYQFEVSPGAHRLEVQGIDASSTEFTVAAGEVAHFTTGQGVTIRNQVEFRTQLYRVKDAADFVPALSQQANDRSGMGCLVAVLGVLFIVAAGITSIFVDEGSSMEAAIAIAAILGLAALVAGSVVAFRTTHRLHQRAKANRLETARVAPGRGGPLTGPAVAFPSPQNAKEWSAGRDVRGPLMVFDLFLYRITRDPDGTVSYTGSREALALASAASVRAWIDDVEVPCDWAAWHYPLASGEHRCRVVYGDNEAAADFTFKVSSVSDMAVVHVPVRVFRIWDEGAGALTDLPPQIAHRVVKRARSDFTKLTDDDSTADNWVPSRTWPVR